MTDPACQIASIEVAPIRVAEFLRTVLDWAATGAQPRLITYLNAHNVNLAFQDLEYLSILQGADLIYADGMGVVWGWKRLGRSLPERVNAGDFIIDFCRHAAAQNVTFFLLGGKPGEAERAALAWQKSAPDLTIVGMQQGYFEESEEADIAQRIRGAAPGILLAGMGAPRQEKWAARWLAELNVPVIWCVGALFEYYGGGRSRAPRWMRNAGLEWTWRLALEPKRLGRRYVIGNWRYLANLAKIRKTLAGTRDGRRGS